MVKQYVPDKGDIVWLDFDPQVGHEQRGHRPAIVLSGLEYNKITGLALFCPITSKSKGYVFEVPVDHSEVSGVILSDQVKSLSWSKRNATLITQSSNTELQAVLKNLKIILMA
jgi:mRNA interferase MazF